MDQLMSVVAPVVGSLQPPLVLRLQLLLWSPQPNQLYRGMVNLRLIHSEIYKPANKYTANTGLLCLFVR